MNWSGEFSNCVREHAPLAPFTWYKLGGPARWLIEPRDAEQLSRVLVRLRDAGVEHRLLGLGANLLVGDEGFDGAVIRLSAPEFSLLHADGPRVTVGAGFKLMDLVKLSARRGLAGLEGLAGIPATLGGAIRMNCGGRYGEIGDRVASVRLMSSDGLIVERRDVRFAYRKADLGGAYVLGASFNLTEENPRSTYDCYQQVWQEKTASQPPLMDRTAGCVFRNPPDGKAGLMIDQAGLKGTRVGGARVSEIHANFIVASAGATAADVLALIELVRDRVQDRTGVRLETEIEIWGAARTDERAVEPPAVVLA